MSNPKDMTAEQRVKAVYPNAEAKVFHLGMDTKEVVISTTHARAYGSEWSDVEGKAWEAATEVLSKTMVGDHAL